MSPPHQVYNKDVNTEVCTCFDVAFCVIHVVEQNV